MQSSKSLSLSLSWKLYTFSVCVFEGSDGSFFLKFKNPEVGSIFLRVYTIYLLSLKSTLGPPKYLLGSLLPRSECFDPGRSWSPGESSEKILRSFLTNKKLRTYCGSSSTLDSLSEVPMLFGSERGNGRYIPEPLQ